METKSSVSELQQKLDELATTMSDAVAAEAPQDPFRSLEQIRTQLKTEIKEVCSQFFEKLASGIQELNETLNTLSKENPDIQSTIVTIPLSRLLEAFTNLEQNRQNGIIPKDVCHLSAEDLKTCNRIAAYLYEKKQYAKSAVVYALLTFLEPREPGFWLGLGNSEYFNNNFDLALRAYRMAALTNPTDIQCLFYACHCHHQLGNIDRTIACIDQVLAVIDVNPSLNSWRQRAEDLKAFFNKINKKR